MKNARLLCLLALGMSFLTACGPTLTPFTQRLQDQYDWTDSELKRIQFYVSRDIVLRREATGGRSEIIGGEIKVVDGRNIDQVVIRKGTPGVLLFQPKDNRFAVGFEASSDSKYLIFGPSPRAGERYVLLASQWQRRGGTVTYDGRKYRVESESAYASLMVDLKKIRKVDVKNRRATGRRVD